MHVVFFCFVYNFYLSNATQNKIKRCSFFLALILSCSIIPIKNYALYGFFGASSWAPLNLLGGLGITYQPPREVPGAVNHFFNSPQVIKSIYPSMFCSRAHHSQDSTLFKSSGQPNYNSCIFLEFANLIKKEGIHGYNPVIHAEKIIFNTFEYFSPSDKYPVLRNREKISNYAGFFSKLQLTISLEKRNQEIRLLMVILLFVGIAGAVLKRNRFLLVSATIVLTHYLTHTLTDGFEGKRFVFDIEFIFFIFLAVAISWVLETDFKKHLFRDCLKPETTQIT
ncbi:MAG: hypothetical protein ACKOA8_04435 [Deltaproteobacteria bacterium]